MIEIRPVPNSEFQEISYDDDLGRLVLRRMKKVKLTFTTKPTSVEDVKNFA